MRLDRPLSFTRFGYHDKPLLYGTESGYTWPPVTIIPHWNSAGEASTGSYLSGVVRKKVTPHSSHVHELWVDWELGGPAYSRVKPSTGMIVPWMGTLITQKRDLTGTLYRRHRYYDPGTGRFTQQDPIGLAGGLNLYGYAGGDPINFSDPFGLCATENDETDTDADSTKAKPKLACVYQQESGNLTCTDQAGKKVVDETGYAGRSFAKNWTEGESMWNFGPIPRGTYSIGGYTASKGPLTITLTPSRDNIMFGRSAFRIHGDSRQHPGEASEGCIIVGRTSRQTIATSSASTLRVVR